MPITKSSSSIKAGTVEFFAQSSAPAGWIKANGAAVSRSTYAALFTAIGTTYGAGNGSTTFNVPDLRGEFVRSLDDGRGVDSGRGLGTSQGHDMQSHNHIHGLGNDGGITGRYGNVGGLSSVRIDYEGSNISGTQAVYTSSTGNAETRPRNVALLACIKY